MVVAIPCPICFERDHSAASMHGRPLHSGEPGLGFVELDPVEGKKGVVECIYGHKFKLKLERVGIFGRH